MRSFNKSSKLRTRFHQSIPGGCHTYAKADDQYPEFQAPIMIKGKGCRAWDIDGNEYIEYGMGLRSVSLGHAYPKTVEAAHQQMCLGNNHVRPAYIELQAAETLLRIVPGADMVKFAKNGSDVTTAAIKLARAYTGKSKIAICKDHPFFSADDWFIGHTPMNAGIPEGSLKLTVSFRYNDIESVRALFRQNPEGIACLILEPEKYESLDLQYFSELQEICRENGTLLILDEIITGFRWHIGGAQTLYGLTPDLSTFGKAMGNGFAVAALVGKKEIMELGGIYSQRDRVFLLSNTHGAEHHSLAAFISVVEEYEKKNVIDYLRVHGNFLKGGFEQIVAKHRLQDYLGIHGHPSCLVYSTRDKNQLPSQTYRTLFLQECLKRGLLAPSLVLSYSHTKSDIEVTLDIIEEVANIYARALDEGIGKYMDGRSIQPVFRKRNISSAMTPNSASE